MPVGCTIPESMYALTIPPAEAWLLNWFFKISFRSKDQLQCQPKCLFLQSHTHSFFNPPNTVALDSQRLYMTAHCSWGRKVSTTCAAVSSISSDRQHEELIRKLGEQKLSPIRVPRCWAWWPGPVRTIAGAAPGGAMAAPLLLLTPAIIGSATGLITCKDRAT